MFFKLNLLKLGTKICTRRLQRDIKVFVYRLRDKHLEVRQTKAGDTKIKIMHMFEGKPIFLPIFINEISYFMDLDINYLARTSCLIYA